MKGHVLLVNEFFSDNVGDQAISMGFERLISDLGFSVSRHGYSSGRSNMPTVVGDAARSKSSAISIFLKKYLSSVTLLRSFIWGAQNIVRLVKVASRNADFAVVGGGQLIMAKSNFAIAMLCWVLLLKFFGKKVYLLSVGVGENVDGLERWMYRVALSKADEVYVRDHAGRWKLSNIISRKINFLPDAAYYIQSSAGGSRCGVGVFITDYSVSLRYSSEVGVKDSCREEYWARWSSVVQEMVNEGRSLYFLWTTEADRDETQLFLKHYPQFADMYAGEALPLDDLLQLLGRLEFVIAGRMHALILAHVQGCMLRPWIISRKIEIFSHEYLASSPADLRQLLFTTVGALLEARNV
ncbi:polysaccharide pyruvyl transferase family protein [Pseudomonas sediminis]|uniref:Polysaccharide pyruvyl transferase family protein n=1 Tax=Pseudomonas sediminis TaxID=1691904 RepID=A0ABX6SCQ6_9PSED|nr:polysaccharide pyruvyl transferase family protein [Pseudomonas sediminis]QNG99597.1 polysaccharide pyruvyl transferase family protein [Pseudomonas sediminis]